MTTTEKTPMTTKACYCGATTNLEFFCHVTGSRWVCVNKVACSARAKAAKEAKLNTILGAAMAKAGVAGTVIISAGEDRKDPYADYVGYVVSSDSPELAARAAKWLGAWVAQNTTSTYVYAGTVSELDGRPFVVESRYSLGD